MIVHDLPVPPDAAAAAGETESYMGLIVSFFKKALRSLNVNVQI